VVEQTTPFFCWCQSSPNRAAQRQACRDKSSVSPSQRRWQPPFVQSSLYWFSGSPGVISASIEDAFVMTRHCWIVELRGAHCSGLPPHSSAAARTCSSEWEVTTQVADRMGRLPWV
jgi:hypothetical protein